ncbi:hypothetical protein DY000_02010569 [Brassica cretica]|uniref:PPM-type phosphatase domain-containing protein n=2 Tax=Brassica cretica TaxID=69181 RepID=A0ABQ7C1Z4_BRACR|nr:hypothetical protein DY000_02010569 [Brassica cretica]
MVEENPELALMGSCVLVTLMKGEDVYVMNVGDSRAVLARKPNVVVGSKRQKELERIKEVREMFMNGSIMRNSLVPLQLNKENSTRIEEEVRRIKKEHPEDDGAIENRIDYIGTSPYITCSPSLCHHKLTSRDKFLILSSDGLYEYFSNQEAIFEVESFISAFPEGDPAQHLIQEVLLRVLPTNMGKAGEDRVHVVVSEENGWVFVGIYDGFSGPDAPDYLLNNLYTAVQKELNGLLCNDEKLRTLGENGDTQIGKRSDKEDSDSGKENFPVTTNIDAVASGARNQEKSVKWRCEWENNDTKSDNDCDQKGSNSTTTDHGDVLKALVQALRKTEESYLELADTMVEENPELALMGSCVLVTLMKGEDVYVMNVGDSRAVLARKSNVVVGSRRQKELERTKEVREMFMNGSIMRNSLVPLQLNKEHSTRIEEEVRRIKKEHPEDDGAIENDRVKGYLKVTRAFGAGFLKQPKWNDALLEMFRIDYIGTSPYITCSPSLCHHKLTSHDKFLILSSDGLYEYFSNQEAIFEVESFISAFPEGDPAQHLIQEVLLRAANKYGMDFHELLEIPQGDRRRYHDDISVIVISLEGRIWRSSM